MFDTHIHVTNIDYAAERRMKRTLEAFAKFEAEQLEERISKLPIDKVIKACLEVNEEIPMWYPDEILTASLASQRQQHRVAALKFKLTVIEKEIWEKEHENQIT